MTNPQSASKPPAAKEGWDHSQRCLVHYPFEGDNPYSSETWGIAYYHYKPPFDEPPGWIDFAHRGRQPDFWWELPKVPVYIE